jgi:peptidoglycan/LPS O-acetylase OafA/YrhL
MTGAVDANRPGRAVLPNLDGIRAVACLLVVASHMPLPGKPATMGSIGVALFFVLSGFLMGHLYARTPWDAQQVGSYAIARFSRIAPIYWLVVTLCIGISWMEPDGSFQMQIVGPYQIARHYLFAGSGNVFWSIPPEIQYYLFFLVVWWAMARQRQHAWALGVLGLLCASLVFSHALWPGLSLPHKLHLFLAGTVAGLAPRHPWSRPQERKALVLLQLGALALALAPAWLYDTQAEMYLATELGLAFGLVVYWLSIPSGWTTWAFASRPMRSIGRASFSIYLMHVLVFFFGMRWLGLSKDQFEWRWIVLGILAVALPMLASRLLEIPLQQATRRALTRLSTRLMPAAA